MEALPELLRDHVTLVVESVDRRTARKSFPAVSGVRGTPRALHEDTLGAETAAVPPPAAVRRGTPTHL